MQIAIMSDTHSNAANTRAALEIIRERGVSCVLHCGDICDPETVRLFHGLTTHFVRGNNDFDEPGLRAAIAAIGGTYHGAFAQLEMAGKRLAMLHGDDWRLLERVQKEQLYDYVLFGHLHQFSRNHVGRSIVINPGALHRARPKTFVLLDLASGFTQQIALPETLGRQSR